MNFTQMHERLRLELLRRIQRGSLSITMLAHQTGYGPSHLSNFLRSRRMLSLEALDRILQAQHMEPADLLRFDARQTAFERCAIPVVSHLTAANEPSISSAAVQSMLYLPASLFLEMRTGAAGPRRNWHRLVAVRIAAPDAAGMDPIVRAEALVILDRHYVSLAPLRPPHPNLYAVREDARLKLGYVQIHSHGLVLRPHNLEFPLEFMEPPPGEKSRSLIAGRVMRILNQV